MGKTIVLAFGDYDTGYTDRAGNWHEFNRTWPDKPAHLRADLEHKTAASSSVLPTRRELN